MPSKNAIHIQGRLLRDRVREADAAAVYDELIKAGWKDREIVREALIAFGEMQNQGWQPQQVVTEVKLTETMVRVLRRMEDVVSHLATLDFSTLRHGDGRAVDVPKIQHDLSELEQGAKSLLGNVYFADDEDDED